MIVFEPREVAEKTLIYLHLPKTGGTSVIRILQDHFGIRYHRIADGRQDSRALEDYWKLDAGYKQGIKVLSGHVPYGVHENLSQPSIYSSTVRHPVERMISTYYFVLERPHHYLYPIVSTSTLEEFATNLNWGTTDNAQTRFLSGCTIVGDMPSSYRIGRDWLEKAYENIARDFILLGVTEELNAFMSMLAYLLGIDLSVFPAENIGRTRPPACDIPPRVRDAILECNQLDYELYQFARKKFEETYQQFLARQK